MSCSVPKMSVSRARVCGTDAPQRWVHSVLIPSDNVTEEVWMAPAAFRMHSLFISQQNITFKYRIRRPKPSLTVNFSLCTVWYVVWREQDYSNPREISTFSHFDTKKWLNLHPPCRDQFHWLSFFSKDFSPHLVPVSALHQSPKKTNSWNTLCGSGNKLMAHRPRSYFYVFYVFSLFSLDIILLCYRPIVLFFFLVLQYMWFNPGMLYIQCVDMHLPSFFPASLNLAILMQRDGIPLGFKTNSFCSVSSKQAGLHTGCCLNEGDVKGSTWPPANNPPNSPPWGYF